MTPDDIRRDRAICDAATGGPWRADGRDVVQLTDSGNATDGPGTSPTIAETRTNVGAEIEESAVSCPHCQAGEPSVWDDVLFHYAHPAAGNKLKMCHHPWRERCRRCSADVAYVGARFCGAACSQLHEMKAPQ